MSDKQEVHKLVIKAQSANTLCGLNIIVLYTNTMRAMTDVAGVPNVFVTLFKGVTCPVCKKKDKEGG